MDKLTIGKYTFEHWDAGDHKTWLISTPGGGVMSNEAEYLSVLIAEVRRRAAPGVVEALERCRDMLNMLLSFPLAMREVGPMTKDRAEGAVFQADTALAALREGGAK